MKRLTSNGVFCAAYAYLTAKPAGLVQGAFALSMAAAALSTSLHAVLGKIDAVRLMSRIATGLAVYLTVWSALEATDYVICNSINYAIRTTICLLVVTLLLELFHDGFRYTWLVLLNCGVFFVPSLAVVPVVQAHNPVFNTFQFLRTLLDASHGNSGLVALTAVCVALNRLGVMAVSWRAFRAARTMRGALVRTFFLKLRVAQS